MPTDLRVRRPAGNDKTYNSNSNGHRFHWPEAEASQFSWLQAEQLVTSRSVAARLNMTESVKD